MAIAFDNSTDGGFSSATSGSFNHTNTAGNYLFVTVFVIGTVDQSPTVSYNGTSMTKLLTSPSDAQDGEYAYLFGLANPVTGTHSVAWTLSANPVGAEFGVQSYSGASATQPDNSSVPAAVNSAGQTSITGTVTINVANSWLMMWSRSANNQSAGSGTTARNTMGGASSVGNWDSNGALSAGSHSLQTTMASSNLSKWFIISIAPFGRNHNLSLLGCGT